ncbi:MULTISPECIES: PEP/pyruvate-binding domain-containing protein [unclassified Aureispira]|uniref:PEP/pyruvate-binding domain-containing protein n=1 Tax=unclassified Aureispira TaxID=2649989 RepID=UPI000695C9AD|nr:MULTISPECIES: PEP/pyruvate-binding domain-containing protein [unclassified Aureispira]WMX12318.1 hypothetical protein QP953_15930 [Aureispira sp. CCB-E]
MRLFFSIILVYFFLARLQAQSGYAKPDFAVQYISYFGIGSASVQKSAIIGHNAANYALMQQALPKWTDQGLGIPVYFYQKTIEDCGADLLIQKLEKEYNVLEEKELAKRLQKIRETILVADIPKGLSNQLKNAIQEFYKGKKIRISSSPNYYSSIKTFSISTSLEDLSPSITQVYASFWKLEAVKERFKNKENKQFALGLLITQGFEYGYAIGRVQTDYSGQFPSIHIMSKRESSTERIGFPRFDSKWYRTYEKAKKAAVFVDNASLTPTVRDLQQATIVLDPILRAGKDKKLSDKNYNTVFTFIIKKLNGKFQLKLQQPELQLTHQ